MNGTGLMSYVWPLLGTAFVIFVLVVVINWAKKDRQK